MNHPPIALPPRSLAVTGFMKLSVAVAGPGEELRVAQAIGTQSSIEKEAEDEQMDIFSNPEIPRGVKRHTKYLVTGLYQVEDLPFLLPPSKQETLSKRAASSMEVYVTVEVGTKSMHSKTVRVERPFSSDNGAGAHGVKVIFNTEIWLPVELPMISDHVKYRFWSCAGEKEYGGERVLIATHRTSFKNILSCSRKVHYSNLYGSQLDLWTNVDVDDSIAELYNQHHSEYKAPNYRGRVLIRQKIKDSIPSENHSSPPKTKSGSSGKPRMLRKQASTMKKMNLNRTVSIGSAHRRDKRKLANKAFRRHMSSGIREEHLPPTRGYKIYAVIISGTEIPEFPKDPTNGRKQSIRANFNVKEQQEIEEMCIKVQCGSHTTYSSAVKNTNGVCHFSSLLEFPEESDIVFPQQLEQVPDIIVSVCKVCGEDTPPIPVSYERFQFKRIYDVGMGPEAEVLKWYNMREDKASNLLGNEMFPGSILMKLGCFEDGLDETVEVFKRWKDEVTTEKNTKKRYQLRCHIYQGADLPSVERDELLDPYIRINFNGQEPKESRVDHRNNYPQWYETIVFDSELPMVPAFFPQVNVQLWDEVEGEESDYLSCIMAPLGAGNCSTSPVLPQPQWFDLFIEEKGDTTGKILCSFQLVDMLALDLQSVPRTLPIIKVGRPFMISTAGRFLMVPLQRA